MSVKVYETQLRLRAYQRYLATKSTDTVANYYATLADVREEMLHAVRSLFYATKQLEASPNDFFFLNRVEYENTEEMDFPLEEIERQIECVRDGRLEFRYPAPYYCESGDAAAAIPKGWTFAEEPPIKPNNPQRHVLGCRTDGGYDSSEERDLVFTFDVFGLQPIQKNEK